MYYKLSFLIGVLLLAGLYSRAQSSFAPKTKFTHADTLRGSITPERAWWDLLKYDLRFEPDFNKKSLKGENTILFKVVTEGQTMQIDLQPPMNILSVLWRGKALTYTREENVFHVRFPRPLKVGSVEAIQIKYEGVPGVAIRPPWAGGWTWTTDKQGRPWMSVSCYYDGASLWFPCKDHPADEPDSGVVMHITVPDSLVGVGNGRLREKKVNGNGTTTYTWVVVNPINSYDIIPYIGKYVGWSEVHPGLKGKLDCNFWVLDYNLEKAKLQFKQVDTMLDAHEYWMGPYPFYEDGYKLVEAPYLGMEHQSNVAYGNNFVNGVQGSDGSGTGWGMKWDFIIVHESGHEWFGNSITEKDGADMWLHEGFTDYSETLYTTYLYGVEAGNDYLVGSRRNILNDRTIIGYYGVYKQGSQDMYYKGGNMLHMIRQIMGDSAYRGLLHGLSRDFYHQTVTTQQVEAYISHYAGKDFSKVFDQYLRTIKIPVLEYKTTSDGVSYRWGNCVSGFNMPVRVFAGGLPEQWITPTEEWQTLAVGDTSFSVDRNFYITVKKAD